MWWSLGPKPVKLVKMMEGVNSFYDQLSMAQDVKKGKLVLSPERGLERASTRDSAYFNSRIRSLGSTRGGLPGEGSPRSPMADPSEASPSSLVIHSPSPDVFNSMKHTLGCLVMVSAIKLNVDPSVLMGGIHEVLDMIAQNLPLETVREAILSGIYDTGVSPSSIYLLVCLAFQTAKVP